MRADSLTTLTLSPPLWGESSESESCDRPCSEALKGISSTTPREAQ
jgi:hypothetical protein